MSTISSFLNESLVLQKTDEIYTPEEQVTFDLLGSSFWEGDIHIGFSILLFVINVSSWQ